jgi:PTH1 family peptidyl-tRNA hydrolase
LQKAGLSSCLDIEERGRNMYIIAGLGNPGLKYRHTRHNAGFDAIDVIAKRHGITVKKIEKQALVGQGNIKGQKVLLVKPQTFMNNSGDSLAELVNYYKVDPTEELIVLSDDVTLDPGRIRIRKKGSAGGHNGLKSIIARCGTESFQRVRIGVGILPTGGDMINHVLGHLKRDERKSLEEALEHAADAIELMINGETEAAMNKFN